MSENKIRALEAIRKLIGLEHDRSYAGSFRRMPQERAKLIAEARAYAATHEEIAEVIRQENARHELRAIRVTRIKGRDVRANSVKHVILVGLDPVTELTDPKVLDEFRYDPQAARFRVGVRNAARKNGEINVTSRGKGNKVR